MSEVQNINDNAQVAAKDTTQGLNLVDIATDFSKGGVGSSTIEKSHDNSISDKGGVGSSADSSVAEQLKSLMQDGAGGISKGAESQSRADKAMQKGDRKSVV